MRWFFAYVFGVLAGASAAHAQFSGGGGPATGSPLSNSELQQRCDAGYAAACDSLGLRYYKSGKGSAAELKKSVALFQSACDSGDAIGCSHLARNYLYGRGVKEDHARAIRLSETACKGDAEIGCFIMGLAYDDGLAGYPRDRNRAISYYRLACGNGTKFDHACEILAELGASSSIPQVAPVVAAATPQPDLKAVALAANEAGVAAYNRRDFGAAVEDFATACNRGLAMGCYNLAMRYWNGEGVAADKPYALQLYKRSCAEGVTMACAQASAASTPTAVAVAGASRGSEVVAPVVPAQRPGLTLLQLGAIQFQMGVAHLNARNFKVAEEHFDTACEYELAEGCFNLATMYEDGTGIGRDMYRASNLYRAACEDRMAKACYNLGNFYYKGTGVPYSLRDAEKYYRLALSFDPGMTAAASNLEIVERLLRK